MPEKFSLKFLEVYQAKWGRGKMLSEEETAYTGLKANRAGSLDSHLLPVCTAYNCLSLYLLGSEPPVHFSLSDANPSLFSSSSSSFFFFFMAAPTGIWKFPG